MLHVIHPFANFAIVKMYHFVVAITRFVTPGGWLALVACRPSTSRLVSTIVVDLYFR